MTGEPRRYGVDVCYGTCQIDRCLEALRFWEEELDGMGLFRKMLREASTPDTKASTLEHFIREFFAHRFLTDEGLAWSRILRRHGGAMSRLAIEQITFLLCARYDPMVRDFVLTEYWPRIRDGQKAFPLSMSADFLNAAEQAGRPGAVWSASRFEKLRSGLNGICAGYGLWRKGPSGGSYRATPPALHPEVALLLALELHERGLSDEEVVTHRDWAFFGLDREKVIRMLQSSRNTSELLVQSSGDLVSISWRTTMMEAANRHDC